jgi:predicted nucleic-acid-binding protein
MIGVDTNIVLRYLLADDDQQHRLAVQLIDQTCSPDDPALVSGVVLVEIAWFLSRQLRLPRAKIVDHITALLDNTHLLIANSVSALLAVIAYRDGRADFADYFIAALNREHGVDRTFTFDQDASRDGALVLLTTGTK